MRPRLLVLALACQASISIVQWGLGVIAPDLQARYDLSAASLGALVNATAFGNAVALMRRGRDRRSLGAAQAAARMRDPRAAACSSLGALLTNPVGLGVALFASGVAGALVAVGATVSVFHGFPPERRGFALGMRQMSVALGGLLAAVLLPLAVHVGGVRLALLLSGVLTAVDGSRVRARHAARPARAAERGAPRRRALRGAARAGHGDAARGRLCYIVALVAVLTFAVPALRDGGASRGEGSVLFALVSISAMAARIAWGRLADAGGGRGASPRCATSASSRARPRLLTWAVWPEGTAVRIAALVLLELRRARLQRRALPDRRRDRGRGARRARRSR